MYVCSVFCSSQTFFKCFLLVLFILLLFYLGYRAIDYTKYYPTLIGLYCFTDKPPIGYIENKNINDSIHIQQCSLQNIDACQLIHNQTLLFRLHWTAGFASEVNNLIRAFIYAINTRRRFLIDDQYWNYGSFVSFFNISQGHFSPWLPSSSYCLKREFVHPIQYIPNSKGIPEHFTISRDTNGGFSTLNLIMQPFEQNNQTLQTKRTVAQYLWNTINQETRHFIDHYLNEIQLNTIYYAIHIRRGDKLLIEAIPISIEKYIDGVEYFMKQQQQNVDRKHRIFVASDQHDTINELRSLRPHWDFVQLYSQVHRWLHGHEQSIFNGLPSHTKLESTRRLLTELEILSRVNYVVCTFSSNICRLVQIIRKQKPDTVLSLDQEWHSQ